MLTTTLSWLDGLREFAATRRLQHVRCEADSQHERAAERMILATHLAGVLGRWDAVAVARRASRNAHPGRDPDPAIVITTSPTGIDATEEHLANGSLPAREQAARTVAVTELEYRLWCIRHPDDAGDRHVNVWNWVKTSVPRERHGEFARHPLGKGEAYWLHRAGIANAGEADRRECHLWKWNGRHAALLEAFVTEKGVSELT